MPSAAFAILNCSGVITSLYRAISILMVLTAYAISPISMLSAHQRKRNTMAYNRTEIMKRAWIYARQDQWS